MVRFLVVHFILGFTTHLVSSMAFTTLVISLMTYSCLHSSVSRKGPPPSNSPTCGKTTLSQTRTLSKMLRRNSLISPCSGDSGPLSTVSEQHMGGVDISSINVSRTRHAVNAVRCNPGTSLMIVQYTRILAEQVDSTQLPRMPWNGLQKLKLQL
ncbi:UNVERIFIED_CONTAM: hypothetical protein FKN15_028638 [Acipenser sinensis]